MRPLQNLNKNWKRKLRKHGILAVIAALLVGAAFLVNAGVNAYNRSRHAEALSEHKEWCGKHRNLLLVPKDGAPYTITLSGVRIWEEDGVVQFVSDERKDGVKYRGEYTDESLNTDYPAGALSVRYVGQATKYTIDRSPIYKPWDDDVTVGLGTFRVVGAQAEYGENRARLSVEENRCSLIKG